MQLKYDLQRLPDKFEVMEVLGAPNMPLGVKLYIPRAQAPKLAKQVITQLVAGTRLEINILMMTREEFEALPTEVEIPQGEPEKDSKPSEDVPESYDPSKDV